jgi:acetolactate synthase regulatory subunit
VAAFRSDLPPTRGAQISLTVAPAGTARLLARVCLLLAQRGIEIRVATFTTAAVHPALKLIVDVPAATELVLLRNKLERLIEVIDVTVDEPARADRPTERR